MVHFRKKRATHFGNLRILKKVHGFRRFDVSPVILITKIALIVLIFLVATDAIEIRQNKPIPNQDYLILLDSSASMAKTDFNPNRLSAAKEISKKWLDILQKDTRVGMVSFAQDIRTSVPLTTNKKEVKEDINSISIDYTQSGTSLDYAINYAVDLIEDDITGNTILLLTDGTEDVKEETIAYVNSKNVRIFTFGIGERQTDEITMLDMDDEDIPEELRETYNPLEFNFTKLQELSNKTNGMAFKVSNSEELTKAFNQATLAEVNIKLNSGYYLMILIALISIIELIIYSKVGAL